LTLHDVAAGHAIGPSHESPAHVIVEVFAFDAIAPLQLWVPVHCRSQVSVALQVIVLSHESPAHLTVQLVPPHVMSSAHDCPPLQSITQLEASLQSMSCVQEFCPQLISHGTPGGQVIGNAHWMASHSNVQVLPTQLPPAFSQLWSHCAASGVPSGSGPSAIEVSTRESIGAADGLYWQPIVKQIAIRYRTPSAYHCGWSTGAR
jgi:hypothetical protein